MNQNLLAKEKLKFLLNSRVLLEEEDNSTSEPAKMNKNKRRSKIRMASEQAGSKSKPQLKLINS